MNIVDEFYTCCANRYDCLSKLRQLYKQYGIPIVNNMHDDCDKYWPNDDYDD